jgi:phosphate transport system permease protein
MATTMTPSPTTSDVPSSLRGSRRGRMSDPLFRILVTGAGLTTLLILGWMLYATTSDAMPVFQKEGFLGFVTGTEWDPGNARDGTISGEYGALPFLAGTIYSAVIAMLIAVPMAIGIALYLTQLAPRRIRQPLTYLVDLLAAVPSIIYGLVGARFLSGVMFPVWDQLVDWFSWVPGVGERATTFNLFFASLVLAIMVLPITCAVIREVFATVPRDERFAAYGLGATRWEVMKHVVIARSRPGIIGGSMLGLGRALGETIAVLLIIGGNSRLGLNLFDTSQTVAAQIAAAFKEASPEYVRALIGLGVALFVLTMAVNVIARVIVNRMGHVTGDASL